MASDKRVDVSGDQGEIASFAQVRFDGYFVSVVTDDYEGHAHFHKSVIPSLIEQLQKIADTGKL